MVLPTDTGGYDSSFNWVESPVALTSANGEVTMSLSRLSEGFAGKDLVFGLAVQRGKIDILGIDLFLFEKCHGGSPSVSGYTGFQDRYKKSGRAAVPCLIGTRVYFR